MGKQKGFSLIELLIVVAIILIIAAIAIPNLMRSRMAANNAAAVSTIRSLNTSQVTFSTTYQGVGFASSLTALGPGASTCAATGPTSTNACLIDYTLGCATQPCTRDAFVYQITGVGTSPTTDYIVFAKPAGPSAGNIDVCSTADSVIRGKADNSASGTTPTAVSACQGSPYAPL